MQKSIKNRQKLLDMCGSRLLLGKQISIKDIMAATGYKKDSVSRVLWQIRTSTFSKNDRDYMVERFGKINFPVVKPHMKVGIITDRRKTLLKACYNDGEIKSQTQIASTVGYSRVSVANTIKHIEEGTLSSWDVRYVGELFADNVFALFDCEDEVFDESELQSLQERSLLLIKRFQKLFVSFDKWENLSNDYLRNLYGVMVDKILLKGENEIAKGIRLDEARKLEKSSVLEIKTYNVVFNSLDQMIGEQSESDKELSIEIKPKAFGQKKKEN